MQTTLWFTYVYKHNPHAPAVVQRVKLVAGAGEVPVKFDRLAHVTNHIFGKGFVAAKFRPVVHWEGLCGKKIEEFHNVQEVLSWGVGHCEEKPLRLIIGWFLLPLLDTLVILLTDTRYRRSCAGHHLSLCVPSQG